MRAESAAGLQAGLCCGGKKWEQFEQESMEKGLAERTQHVRNAQRKGGMV